VQLKIAYLLMRWSLGLVVLVLREDVAKDAELMLLRHEKRGPAPARRPGAVRARRPGPVRRAGAGPPAPALVRDLPRDTRDAAGLAPQTAVLRWPIAAGGRLVG
jgi:hypothetical protein